VVESPYEHRKPDVTVGLPGVAPAEVDTKTILIELGKIYEKLDRIERALSGVRDLPAPSMPRSIHHAAAASQETQIMDVDLRILDALKFSGPLTSQELAEKCGFKDRSSFQRRYLKPLVQKKIVMPVKRGRKVVYRI
jgi:hypothetical protein